MLSIAPLTALTVTVTKLNKERRTNIFTAMGALLLTMLVVLMIPLTKFFKTEGAALTTIVIHTTKITTLNELHTIAKLAVNTLLQKR